MRIFDQKPSLENALQHFGIKGMRWGVRSKKTGPGGRPLPTRKQLRGMNKQAKARQKLERKAAVQKDTQEIYDARARVNQSHAHIRAAKKKYKTNKKLLGKVTAREILAKTTKKDYETLARAGDQTRNEALGSLIGSVGAVALVSAIGPVLGPSQRL